MIKLHIIAFHSLAEQLRHFSPPPLLVASAPVTCRQR